MSKVYMSAPAPITNEDWEYYLQQPAGDYIISFKREYTPILIPYTTEPGSMKKRIIVKD